MSLMVTDYTSNNWASCTNFIMLNIILAT